ASVAAFHAAVIRSYPPPPPDSEEARRWLEQGFRFPAPAALPRFDDVEALPAPRPAMAALPEIDVALDDSPGIDWSDPSESYVPLGNEVALPDAQALLESLSVASRETFHHEDAMWNLALCLAYGSDELGAAAARAFFDAVAHQGGGERLDWMSRT